MKKKKKRIRFRLYCYNIRKERKKKKKGHLNAGVAYEYHAIPEHPNRNIAAINIVINALNGP